MIFPSSIWTWIGVVIGGFGLLFFLFITLIILFLIFLKINFSVTYENPKKVNALVSLFFFRWKKDWSFPGEDKVLSATSDSRIPTTITPQSGFIRLPRLFISFKRPNWLTKKRWKKALFRTLFTVGIWKRVLLWLMKTPISIWKILSPKVEIIYLSIGRKNPYHLGQWIALYSGLIPLSRFLGPIDWRFGKNHFGCRINVQSRFSGITLSWLILRCVISFPWVFTLVTFFRALMRNKLPNWQEFLFRKVTGNVR